MSQITNSTVHTGSWINWSHGRVVGSTITLSERNGGLLTAFLATFVTAAGVAFWSILSYSLHQARAVQEEQPTIHHQEQATLRNAGTPGAAAWQLIQLSWYWRKHAIKSIRRTLPIILLALFNIVCFGLASIFSSEVTRAAGNEVLIRSPQCGVLTQMNSTGINSPQNLNNLEKLEVNITATAATYAQACYGQAHNPLQCGQYAQRSLSWKLDQNASCPFSTDLCYFGATAAYSMDSGRLDSHQAFGMNAPKADRVQYRKLTTCAPIHAKDHAEVFNNTNPEAIAYGDTLINYLFGPVSEVSNYTYQYNIHSLVDNNGYLLTSLFAFAGDPNQPWEPISALNRTDADVSIFFLAANSITYSQPVTDPFYTATTLNQIDGTNITYYSPDYQVTVLACTDQHQFCNPSNGNCTPLSATFSLGQDALGSHQLNFNVAQYTTAQIINTFIASLTTYGSVHTRGTTALRASETVDDNKNQIGLPNTQWMTEISSWYGVSMAKLQQKIVQYATGPPYIPDGFNVTGPLTKDMEKICNNQIIRSTGGTLSFSVLGVAIILIIGAILILTSLMIDPLMQFIRRKTGWKEYKSLHWIVDEKWQWQRLAYEEAGQGHWSGGASSVPITRKDDKVGLPRNVDMKHPRLSKGTSNAVESNVGMPEAEALIEQKEMNQRSDYVKS
ncbi:MAG: hypothetical protein Q9170_008033 [Blastenia crenularia]